MPKNITHLFPPCFLNKRINFPKSTLANLFKLGLEAIHQFTRNELNALDPLVCENACHIRAFTLWHLAQKYTDQHLCSRLQEVIHSLNNIIQRIDTLPEINERVEQTIEHYLQTHHLYLALDQDISFDIQFIFLSYLLTLTKQTLPSSSFMLYEKTCLNALSGLGLVHNKIKSLVSSAQKELSSLSCQVIQRQSKLSDNDALPQLLVTRYDEHKRSYLPQYSTAKVILLNALQNNIPFIIKISRFVQNRFYDEITIGLTPAANKKDFVLTSHIHDEMQVAIICEGLVNYSEQAESPECYLKRLNRYSFLQLLLANFAAHPQFSGTLRHTPCIYKEALEKSQEFKAHIAQEWEEFNQHAYLAKKEGCSLENPQLLLLNHVFSDSIVYYPLHDISRVVTNEIALDKTDL